MNCEETQELVDAYVDRELDLAKSLELERHLSECDACSKRHAGLLALRSAMITVYHTPPAIAPLLLALRTPDMTRL